jgi:hypothetical protein
MLDSATNNFLDCNTIFCEYDDEEDNQGNGNGSDTDPDPIPGPNPPDIVSMLRLWYTSYINRVTAKQMTSQARMIRMMLGAWMGKLSSISLSHCDTVIAMVVLSFGGHDGIVIVIEVLSVGGYGGNLRFWRCAFLIQRSIDTVLFLSSVCCC